MSHPAFSPWSRFGQALASGSGIEELMDDLGHALAEGNQSWCMLGGGNPAHIPAVEAVWKSRLEAICADPAQLRRVLAVYDPPRGNSGFLRALADMLQREYGWDIGPEHLTITGGGQTAFFFLFNLLAGRRAEGQPVQHILFPVMPEYIGYAQQGIDPGSLRGLRPAIEETGPHAFKYRVDFSRLDINENTAALCVSRPTNPSGNVLSDEEMQRLSAQAGERGIPFIIDNAYGHPFPGILFTETRPVWAEHHIFVFSLSKLGLPGTRTAVVVARPEITRALAGLTAVTGLANGNFGQAITRPLVEDGTLLRLAREEIRPFYEAKMRLARATVAACFPSSVNYRLHETGGAMFLWLWLPESRLTSRQWYERLKARGVLVVPGDHFFFGLDESEADWPHRRQCLRLSFSMEDVTVTRGLEIIGEELAKS
jgi:valine--pyruvate aminotransferase